MSRESAAAGTFLEAGRSALEPGVEVPDAWSGQQLVTGRSSDLFTWGEDHVVKLLKRRFRREAAENERHYTIRARAEGIPVPAVGDVVEVGGRNGLVFERLRGSTIKDVVLARPWMVGHYVGMLAKLHAAMHSRRGSSLPRQRRQIQRRISTEAALSRDVKLACVRALAQLDDGDAFCHGDLHSANVLLSERGPCIIDWSGATRGDPMADVAITLLGMRHGHYYLSGLSLKLMARLLSNLGAHLYLRRYRSLRPAPSHELRAWRPVLAAARLSISTEARVLQRIARPLIGLGR